MILNDELLESQFELSDINSFPGVPEAGDSDTRQQMREMALSSHYYLAKVVLGYTKLRPQPQGELCEFLDFIESQREAGNFDLNRSAVYMPRDTYKTTIATIVRAIRRGLKNPNTRGVIVMDTAENAELIGTEISNHFKHNKMLRWLFSEIIPENFNKAKWSADKMTLVRTAHWGTPTFTLIGAFGGIESRHFDWILADDLVVEKHLRSDTEMDKLIHWIGGLEQLLVNDVEGYIDFVGSRKKKGDAYEHIENYYDAKHHKPEPIGPHAEMHGHIAVYSRQIIEDGENLFPYDPVAKSGVSNRYLNRMRRNEPQRFWAQLMNSPKGTGLNTFRIEDIRFFVLQQNGAIDCIEEGEVIHSTNVWAMDRRILFDPAVAEHGTSSMNAIHVIAKGSHPFRFVLESHVGHIPPDECIDLLFELDKKWQPGLISVEKRGFQGWVKYALAMIAELRQYPYLPVVEWPPEGSAKSNSTKLEHIRGFQPITRAHWLWMQEDQHELLEQLEFHPNVRWDDALDALAQDLDYAPYSEDEDEVNSRTKKEDTYLHRSGMDKPDRETVWNEREFLSRLDRTGYALRTR